MKISDTIERKFIETIPVDDFEVETDDGWCDVTNVHTTIPYLKYIIKTSNGKILECADDHILFTKFYEEIFAKDLAIGDKILTKDGLESVVEIINTEEYENMYDLELDEESNHRYYTNHILSHNTLLAKTIAKEVFGKEKYLVRFDMSEYSDKTAVSKLIGTGAGYVGYDNGGLLTEAIKKNKYCVLLCDEIEKADPEIYNVFLQIMDDGRVTDNTGKVVDCKNLILIFTSNVGTREAMENSNAIGFTNPGTDEHKKNILRKELKSKFAPEFINRIDEIIYFNALTDDNFREIIKLELDKTVKKVEEIGYGLVYGEDTVDYILNKIEADREYGARPIMRVIQEDIENKITDVLLESDEPGRVFTVTRSQSPSPEENDELLIA